MRVEVVDARSLSLGLGGRGLQLRLVSRCCFGRLLQPLLQRCQLCCLLLVRAEQRRLVLLLFLLQLLVGGRKGGVR